MDTRDRHCPSPTSSTPTPGQRVRIQTLDGKSVRIDVQPNWTVKKLKEEFGKFKGEGFDKVNLHYQGKRMKDSDLLTVYKINPDGFISANIRSIGGQLENFLEELTLHYLDIFSSVKIL